MKEFKELIIVRFLKEYCNEPIEIEYMNKPQNNLINVQITHAIRLQERPLTWDKKSNEKDDILHHKLTKTI